MIQKTIERRGSLRAILVGTIIDTGGSWLIGGGIGAIVALAAGEGMSGAGSEDLQGLVDGSIPLMLCFAVLGAACSFVGAYTAARLAPCCPVVHALAVGLLGIAIPTANMQELPPQWLHSTSIILIVGLSLLAGRLASQSNAEPKPPEAPATRPPPIQTPFRGPPPLPPPIPPMHG